MKHKRFYIIFLILFSFRLLLAQTEIRQLTLSIVDTTMPETQQAKEIYSWLCKNAKWDLKTIEKVNYRFSSPQALLKNQKGLPDEYAELYKTMCNSIGIEAYTIRGYNKGYLYVKGTPFISSNHTWNVIYSDNKWRHVDINWGAGSPIKKTSSTQKILYSVARIPYSNKVLEFNYQPNDKYFDIPLDSLTNTHYPIDPKWLLSEKILNFNTFQYDSILPKTDNSEFKQNIEKIRQKSFETQLQQEGINAKKHNSLNNFNLAFGYFRYLTPYNIEQEITESNVWQFEKFYDEYEIIINAANRHRALLDSIYRDRYTHLRQVSRDQKRLTGRIKSKTKKAQDAHRSSQKKIVGKSSSYRKKINGYQINIGRAELKKIKLLNGNENVITKFDEVNKLRKEIQELRDQHPRINNQLDSLFAVINQFAVKDAKIDDSISVANHEFNLNVNILGNMILSEQESIIVNYVDSLKNIYQDIEDFLVDKKTAKSDLQKTGLAYYTLSSNLQKLLKQELSAYTKLLKLTNSPDSLIIANNNTVDELISTYKKAIKFSSKLAYHNDIQSDIRSSNLKSLKTQKKSIKKEDKFFWAWYNKLIEDNKYRYTKEKEFIKSIKTTSIKNQKTIELKLRKFKDK